MEGNGQRMVLSLEKLHLRLQHSLPSILIPITPVNFKLVSGQTLRSAILFADQSTFQQASRLSSGDTFWMNRSRTLN